MKKIVISELGNGQVSINANKGVKWTTFITGIELLIDSILENAKVEISIDDVLEDVKRIYERDKEKNFNENISN